MEGLSEMSLQQVFVAHCIFHGPWWIESLGSRLQLRKSRRLKVQKQRGRSNQHELSLPTRRSALNADTERASQMEQVTHEWATVFRIYEDVMNRPVMRLRYQSPSSFIRFCKRHQYQSFQHKPC